MTELDIKINFNLGQIIRFVTLKSIGSLKNLYPIISFNNDDMQPCSANNNFQMFLNINNFKELGLTNFMDLRNKCVVYLIYTVEGVYVGQTKDFNDRMYCHIKDAVKVDYPLYNSLKNNNTAYVSILHCFEGSEENEDMIRGIEKIYTDELLEIKRNNDTLAQYIFNTNK